MSKETLAKTRAALSNDRQRMFFDEALRHLMPYDMENADMPDAPALGSALSDVMADHARAFAALQMAMLPVPSTIIDPGRKSMKLCFELSKGLVDQYLLDMLKIAHVMQEAEPPFMLVGSMRNAREIEAFRSLDSKHCEVDASYGVLAGDNDFGFKACPFCGHTGKKLVNISGYSALVFGMRDELSCKEYMISGLCQACQDDTFREPSQ